MKFLIFTGYGSCQELPKRMKEIFDKNLFPNNRTGEIIDFLEKQEIVYVNDDTSEVMERLEKEKDLILKVIFDDRERYYYFDQKNNYIVGMQIIDININIPWKLDEYDGAEGIVYYKEPKIINKDINMAEF